MSKYINPESGRLINKDGLTYKRLVKEGFKPKKATKKDMTKLTLQDNRSITRSKSSSTSSSKMNKFNSVPGIPFLGSMGIIENNRFYFIQENLYKFIEVKPVNKTTYKIKQKWNHVPVLFYLVTAEFGDQYILDLDPKVKSEFKGDKVSCPKSDKPGTLRYRNDNLAEPTFIFKDNKGKWNEIEVSDMFEKMFEGQRIKQAKLTSCDNLYILKIKENYDDDHYNNWWVSEDLF